VTAGRKKNVKLKVLWWWFDSQSSVHYKNTTSNDITTILLIVQLNALTISRLVSLSVLNIHPEGDLSFSNSCTLVILLRCCQFPGVFSYFRDYDGNHEIRVWFVPNQWQEYFFVRVLITKYAQNKTGNVHIQ